ncbi:MAG: SdpI family protein [Clostridia bacterium]|nr:SdpI family protein [Clostridia bacterium]
MREYIRKNKWRLLAHAVVAAVTLLPMLAGVLLWDRLPEQVATHWGMDGEPNGWSSRGFAVFGLPLILLGLHFVCVAVSERGGTAVGSNPKMMRIMHGICPMISLFGSAAVYAHALGVSFDIHTPALLLLGALLMAVGNYLPKCTRNRWLGIRIKWTLEDDDNWRVTHRFGGMVFMAAGVLLLVCLLLPATAAASAALVILALAVLLPILYSYLYHRRHG